MLTAAEAAPFPTMSPMAGKPDANELLQVPIFTVINRVAWSSKLIIYPRNNSNALVYV